MTDFPMQLSHNSTHDWLSNATLTQLSAPTPFSLQNFSTDIMENTTPNSSSIVVAAAA
jgi:hypothetical protein